MDPKCLLTSTDLQTRRARCQHQLSLFSSLKWVSLIVRHNVMSCYTSYTKCKKDNMLFNMVFVCCTGLTRKFQLFLHCPKISQMSNPCFLRCCFQCQAPDQLVLINFHRLVNVNVDQPCFCLLKCLVTCMLTVSFAIRINPVTCASVLLSKLSFLYYWWLVKPWKKHMWLLVGYETDILTIGFIYI